MKKYLCILAGAALFVACEQKTETATPAAPDKTEHNTTIVNPSPAGGSSSSSSSTTITKPESTPNTSTNTSTSTTTTSTPNP